jgi:hypothetical protein
MTRLDRMPGVTKAQRLIGAAGAALIAAMWRSVAGPAFVGNTLRAQLGMQR